VRLALECVRFVTPHKSHSYEELRLLLKTHEATDAELETADLKHKGCKKKQMASLLRLCKATL
jgi:hypothetical protein